MPIFVYEPAEDASTPEMIPGRECCYFETLQWSSEEPLTQCPECSKSIRRAVTEFAYAGQVARDPLRGVSKSLGDGISAGVADSSAGGHSQARELISSEGKSPASRAARLAYKHICSKNCRH